MVVGSHPRGPLRFRYGVRSPCASVFTRDAPWVLRSLRRVILPRTRLAAPRPPCCQRHLYKQCPQLQLVRFTPASCNAETLPRPCAPRPLPHCSCLWAADRCESWHSSFSRHATALINGGTSATCITAVPLLPRKSKLIAIAWKPFSRPLWFSHNLLLLPPRSALQTAPPAVARNLLRSPYALLLCEASARTRSPSICRAAEFGGYVVTRFLPDDNFHAYRPTVHIRPLLWLCLPVRRFIFCEVHSSSPALLTREGPLLRML